MTEKEQEKTKFRRTFFAELLDFLMLDSYIKNRKKDEKICLKKTDMRR